eukprot:gene19302-6562_t
MSGYVPGTHAKYPYLTETGAQDQKSDWAQAEDPSGVCVFDTRRLVTHFTSEGFMQINPRGLVPVLVIHQPTEDGAVNHDAKDTGLVSDQLLRRRFSHDMYEFERKQIQQTMSRTDERFKLAEGDVVLPDSAAILAYLAGTASATNEKVKLPSNSSELAFSSRAQADAMEFSSRCEELTGLFLAQRDTPPSNEMITKAYYNWSTEIQYWERIRQNAATRYLLSDQQVSLPDIIFFPHLAFM